MATTSEIYKITVNEEQMAIIVQALTDYATKLGRLGTDAETHELYEEVCLMHDIALEQHDRGTGGWFINEFDWTDPKIRDNDGM